MLDFYEIDPNYLNYLRTIDSKIPNLSSTLHDKLVCGVVLMKNGYKYFVPLSSFNRQQRTNFVIKDSGRPIASLRFSFMFPVLDGLFTKKVIKSEMDLNYRRLLNKEYNYCVLHETEILSDADRVYDQVVNIKNPDYVVNCCDFIQLETAASQYVI
jgi:protein AbiQ